MKNAFKVSACCSFTFRISPRELGLVFSENDETVLTDQCAGANNNGNDKVTRRRQYARSEQFQFAIHAGVAERAFAFIFTRRIHVDAVAATLARIPQTFVFVHALCARHLETGRTTILRK